MRTVWAGLSQYLHNLLNAHGLVGIALVIFFEELGIPIPIPGDLMMLLAGIRIAQGKDALWVVLLVEELSTLLGASLLFAASRRFGRSLVLRYGWMLHLGPETLGKVEQRVHRHGSWAIVVARLVPGLRIVTVIAAGVLGVPFRTFVPALALGGFVYVLAYTLIGMFLGPTVLAFVEGMGLPVSALLSLVVLAMLLFAVQRLETAVVDSPTPSRTSLGTSLLAGLVAAGAALLLANAVLGLVSFGVRLLGHAVPRVTTSATDELYLLFGWPVFLFAAGLLAVVSTWGQFSRLSPWRHVALVAGLPLCITLLLIDPLADEGGDGLSNATGTVLIAVATLRWLAYGVLLARLVPLFSHLREPVSAGKDDLRARR